MISQFVLDWMSRNWYFMDSSNNFIFICTSEMKFCRIIIKSAKNETNKFRTFALDPSAGYLFLTKHDPKSRNGAALLRYTMDGAGMTNLLNDKLFYPNDITLDIAMKKIYFLDHYFDFIQQCDYDGSNRRFLQGLPFTKFLRIIFFEDNFYGADSRNLSVIQIKKTSRNFKKVLAENLEANPKMLKVFHHQIQPLTNRSKICFTNNNCEHLCVPSVESIESSHSRIVEKCLCREGFKLENGKCRLGHSTQFLMFVQDNPKMLKAVSVIDSDEQVIAPIVGLKSNIAFDVDLNNKLIYFTSYSESKTSDLNIIEYQSFNGSNRGTIKGDFGMIQSMVFDWVGQNLYFTSQSPKMKIATVKISSRKNESLEVPLIKTLISKSLIGPCSLALDPENGKSYKCQKKKINL